MKNLSILLITILTNLVNYSTAQVNVCLGNDATVCLGTVVNIQDCANIGSSVGGPGTSIGPYQVLNIPYAPDPFTAGTSISLTDDAVSSVQNIGFPFCFFGTSYTQFYIGSNGWISFGAGQPTTFTSATIPTTATNVPKNCIMGPWQDWHPGIGGTIKYQVLGTAPYRRLVVSWNAVPMFSCTTTYGTFQIVIFETTNVIETRIQDKPNCTTWAGGTATHGLHNSAGTVGVIIPGRNSTQWTTTNEGYRFTPGVMWQNSLGQTFPYNGGTLTINQVPPGTTGYWLTGGCGGGTGSAISDTTWITRVTPSITASSTPDMCSAGIGSVTANPGASSPPPYSFSWPALGSSSQTVNNVNGGTYIVNMVDGNGCSANATVVVPNTPATFSATSTLVTCGNGADGTATATMNPVMGTISYLWNDPLAQTTQTATNLAAGTYTCTISSSISPGCTGTATVTVSEIPNLTNTIANQQNVTCNSAGDGIIVITTSQGTPPYNYQWSGSNSVTNSASDLYVGPQQIIITDANNCADTINTVLTEPNALAISNLTPDTQICPEDNIVLSVAGTGGSSAYTFTWKENGTVIGTGNTITVDPVNTNTQYCVTLTETCGSPQVDSCLMINFPTPIQPSFIPTSPELCIPAKFELTNNSANGGEIASSVLEWSDGQVFIENGQDTTSVLFPNPGQYTMIMTSTSIYGCVYKDTLINLVEAKPLPVADFTFSSNPATFFETTIHLQNRSSVDVVNWEWTLTGSNPPYSTISDPTAVYPEGIEGNYPVTLVVTSALGCSDTLVLNMQIISDVLFYAPNTFTPDGDEHNNTWKVNTAGIDIYHFNLIIFNKWGETIWETNDPEAGWDGTYNGEKIQAGTYVWKAQIKEPNNDSKRTFSGFINLLR